MRLLAPSLQIVLMAIAAAIAYGVVHDQVTARVCVEYFTIGHPPVFATSDPTLLGLGWGVIATWWVGLLLGVPLAIVARAGPAPATPPAQLVRPIGLLLLAMGTCALVAGLVGFAAARAGVFVLVESLASRIPVDRHHAFIADGWAHGASYISGFIGGAFVIARTWRARTRATVVDQAKLMASPHATLASPTGAPRWTQQGLVLAAQLVFVPQLGLLFVAAIWGLAPLMEARAHDSGVRLASGCLAAISLALGAMAWKRQWILSRIMTVVLGLPAIWLVLVCIEKLARFA